MAKAASLYRHINMYVTIRGSTAHIFNISHLGVDFTLFYFQWGLYFVIIACFVQERSSTPDITDISWHSHLSNGISFIFVQTHRKHADVLSNMKMYLSKFHAI